MKWNNGSRGKGGKDSSFLIITVVIIAVILAILAFFIFKSQSPVVTAAVEPLSIVRGEIATLKWSSQNVKKLYLGTIPSTENIKEVDSSGSIEISPQKTTEYVFKDKNNTLARVTLTVVEPLPVIEAKVDPKRIIRGQKTVLSWKISNADYIEIDGLGIQQGLTGLIELSPQKNTTFTLKAVGPGGETQTSLTVEVFDPPPVYIVDQKYYGTAKFMDIKDGEGEREYWVVSLEVPKGTLIRAPISGELSIETIYVPAENFGDRAMPCVSVYYPFKEKVQRDVAVFGVGLVTIKNKKSIIEPGDVIAEAGKTGRIFIFFTRYGKDGARDDEEMFFTHFPHLTYFQNNNTIGF